MIDVDVIRGSNLKLGVDPLGGAGVHYWGRIAERYGFDLTSVNDAVDPTFAFMTLDWDGQIRMDPSSPFAMRRLIDLKDRFDLAFACDTDHDRHGIVTKTGGLLPPNHYLSAAIFYLFQHRPRWRPDAGVGKTVVSSAMIDRVAGKLGRPLYETPVGFKWFVDGLLDGSLGFGGEESAGASCLRLDGTAWTTDKDGIVLALLAAEMTARIGRDPAETYLAPYTRVWRSAVRARRSAGDAGRRKRRCNDSTPQAIRSNDLAGEPIERISPTAPGNGAPLGGVKVVSESGWFAARPSGTESIYKIYAESFRDADHLQRILAEAQSHRRRCAGGDAVDRPSAFDDRERLTPRGCRAAPVLPREGDAVPGFRRRVRRPPQHTAVERPALRGDGLKEHLISGNFHDHEVVLRRAGFVERALVEAVEIPSAAAGNEIPNSLLRGNPLVQMLVTVEDDVHVVAHEGSLERRANGLTALLRVVARRIQGVMKEADAPLRTGAPKRAVEPRDLGLVGGMVAVQDHEARVAFGKRVVEPIGHVKRLVVLLELPVVIPEGRVEQHTALQQPLIRFGKLALVVVVVEVVSQHQHEGEAPSGGEIAEHRVGDVLLRRVAAAAVADQREAGRAGDSWKGKEGRRPGADGLLGRRRRGKGLRRFGERLVEEVEDHVGVDIAQDERPAAECELHLLRQLRKVLRAGPEACAERPPSC